MAGKKKADKEIKAKNRREKKAQRKETNPGDDFDDCNYLNNRLLGLGLALKIIPGDGNCLFRALGDQLDGNIHEHMLHRQDVVQFMSDNREDFEPFVEDDLSFDEHTRNLSQLGTFGGNDSIVSFARLYELTVVIHQLNKPLWQVYSEGGNRDKELHISFHNGDHYNSVRKIYDVMGTGPANVHLARLHRKCSTHNVVSSSNPYQTDEVSGVEESDYENVPSANKLYNLIEEVTKITKINDKSKIESALELHNFDVKAAIKELQNAHNSSNVDLWSESGTGSRILGNQMIDSTDVNKLPLPGRKLSAKQQKDLKKKQCRLDKHTVKKSSSTIDTEQDIMLNTALETLSI